ncbi:hypothetical protein SAMN04489761_3000 [Tenacibaculum sp. MAR_2009_124]|uniref:hypothetical protein n=1 Tax=Tenacibaculum sp. MAR_2009_124 TaxID=1250059 RepID=UPI00089A63AD|nr:hypothetical protein [Tenacibaculum sp. MAR_2009_124]SEC44072.1 hypothetical protein SAMN04489761_3000 [Tenacibaculum sp. MAR_2009_124]
MRYLLLILLMGVLPLNAQTENIPPKPSERKIHVVAVQRIFSKNYEGYKFKYSEFVDSSDDFIIPAGFSYSNYRLKEGTLKKRGFKSSDRFVLGAGLDGYIKIHEGIYAGVGLNIPFGYEKTRNLQDKTRGKFLIGFEANQGVRFIPWKELGFVFGINFNQHFINSDVISKEFGYELELGINF